MNTLPTEYSRADLSGLDTNTLGHWHYCKRHTSKCASRCNGKKRDHKACRRKANFASSAFLPRCSQHDDQLTQPGRCQAFEACGWRCHRLAPYLPPFNLCTEHEKGTGTLPCFLLKLPTELRLMIFGHVFPTEVPATRSIAGEWEVSRGSSLLRVNRQISREAFTVLYEKVRFEVMIQMDMIQLCGKTVLEPTCYDGVTHASANVLTWFTTHIRNVHVKIYLLDDRSRSLKVQGTISSEDFILYQIRDMVRKFVTLITRDKDESDKAEPLQKLLVTPVIPRYSSWKLDEIMAVVVFAVDPFKEITGVHHPILCSRIDENDEIVQSHAEVPDIHPYGSYEATYKAYRLEWQTTISQGVKTAWQDPAHPLSRNYTQAKREKERIEKFFVTVREMKRFKESTFAHHSEDVNIFSGWAKPIHLARVAFESRNLFSLAKIRHALKDRWIGYQRWFRSKSSNMAAIVLDTFDAAEAQAITRSHENEFVFPDGNFTDPHGSVLTSWSELRVQNEKEPSRLLRAGYKEWEDFGYVYYQKEDSMKIFPKTPALVRAKRLERPN